jgi:multidrug transporter EmrE-like cation transporter
MASILTVALVMGCAVCFIVCDTMAAHWGKNGSNLALVAVIICSPAGYLLFGYLNKKFQLSVVAGWVNVSICIGTVLVGWLLFKDELTIRHWIGLSLAVASIVVLMTGR